MQQLYQLSYEEGKYMQIYYICERCGEIIAIINVNTDEQEEESMRYLTHNELQDIIKIDLAHEVIHVLSLCEECISLIGKADHLD